MWQYRSTEELYHSDDYLMHYGVLGMKWRNHRYKVYDRKMNKLIGKQEGIISRYKEGVKAKTDFSNAIVGKATEEQKARLSESDKRRKTIAKKTLRGMLAGAALGAATNAIYKRKTGNDFDLTTAISGGAALGGSLAARKARKKVYGKNGAKQEAYDNYNRANSDDDFIRDNKKIAKQLAKNNKKIIKLGEKRNKYK